MEPSSSLADKLIEKSVEAFSLAIEVYNKPSIRYRVEGFSFFICNAWELMLKAHLLKTSGPDSIYYSDNPNRTITLENCVRRVFTNEHSPIHKNLMRIIELRNTSTHFIVEEYEMIYIPLFQACIFNFTENKTILQIFGWILAVLFLVLGLVYPVCFVFSALCVFGAIKTSKSWRKTYEDLLRMAEEELAIVDREENLESDLV